MSGALLAGSAAPAIAQTGIFSIFRQEPAAAQSGASVNPLADAEEDHADWVATRAPLSLMPAGKPAETGKEVPRMASLPMPPRRPSEWGGSAAPKAAAVPAPAPDAEASSEPQPQSTPPLAMPPAQDSPMAFTNPDAPSQGFGFGARNPYVTVSPPGGPQPEQHASLTMPTLPQISTPEEIEAEEEKTPEPTFVEKQTDAVNISCLKPELLSLVRKAGEHFKGTPVITSGQRDRGRRGSYHRKCMAADFFIPGVERASLAKYLRGIPGAGGVGTYCHTKSVHIDTGEPRNWAQCGFRFRFALRK